jgi:hypothetical protein
MITADTELDDARVATRKGVFAFSGGVDSVFALLRHHQGHSGRRTCRPIAAVMVQGFDIPLAAKDTFAVAERAARGILEQLSVPLAIVRTNWKEALSRNWHAEFGAGLVSCLHQFTGLANFGVLGADEDYADLEFPWGSNPVTNHLLSGGKFGIHTEGAGFTRTARVHFIAQFPNAARRLRVCWEGPVTGQNCGICEKCIRTKLNFMASGHDPTVCFDGAPTNADIAGIKTSTPIQIAFLREILRYARREGVTDQWVAVLQRTVIKNSIRQFAGRALRKLRTSATLADRPS